MATKAKAASDAKKVKKDHAATNKPVSPTEDPTDHSASATALASQIDPQGKSGATANAESIEAVDDTKTDEENQQQLEEDQSIGGKLRRSELFFVRDHSTGRDYVGISPQNDPKASEASKLRSTVTPLDSTAPRTGMMVYPKDGDAFNVPDGFNQDSKPEDWARVINPVTKQPLFA